ncbi:MAG: hypothetical protein R3F59_11245 [Myxococcota bacterium]
MFPFDGERTWDYQSDDVTATYKLNVLSVGEFETIEGKKVYTLSTTKECVANDPDCVGDLVYRMSWSSDPSNGVYIWGYDLGDGQVELRPPVQVAYDTMERDESVKTTTGGVVWTSTMRGIESCPIKIIAEWDECGVFEVAADGGDSFPLAGTYWATAGNGIAAFQHEGDEGTWQLSDIDCQGECNGDWW